MQDFMKALTSERKSTALPEEFDYFGKLIGSWQINYVESDSSRVIKGEWHFSRVLEGMAVQDVIILPDYEYGTSLRIFNPDTHAWDVAYGYTGNIIRLEARKQGEMIVLTFTGDERNIVKAKFLPSPCMLYFCQTKIRQRPEEGEENLWQEQSTHLKNT